MYYKTTFLYYAAIHSAVQMIRACWDVNFQVTVFFAALHVFVFDYYLYLSYMVIGNLYMYMIVSLPIMDCDYISLTYITDRY